MGKGFKDSKGKFHPIEQRSGSRDFPIHVYVIRSEPQNRAIIDLPMHERVEALKNDKTVLQAPNSKSASELAKKTNEIVFISKDGSFINPDVQIISLKEQRENERGG